MKASVGTYQYILTIQVCQLCLARCVKYSPLQWLQIHGASEIQRESVRRGGRIAGVHFILYHYFGIRLSWKGTVLYQPIGTLGVNYYISKTNCSFAVNATFYLKPL
jgi:hypothetical protein